MVDFSRSASKTQAHHPTQVLYELSYTGIGQFIAAYAPNATFAALTNPLVIIVLVQFSGVLVPYVAITAFWKYWIYWLSELTSSPRLARVLIYAHNLNRPIQLLDGSSFGLPQCVLLYSPLSQPH